MEEQVVRHALSRGFIDPRQLREALLLREQLQRSGRPADLLAILRARYLRPECLSELSAVYQQLLGGSTFAPPSQAPSGTLSPPPGGGTLALPPGSAGQDAPTVTGGILPAPAAIPDSAVWRSAELLERPSGEDPVAVRQFLNRTRPVRIQRQVPLWQIGVMTLVGGLTVGGIGVAVAFALRAPPPSPPVLAQAKTVPAKTEPLPKTGQEEQTTPPKKVAEPARKHFERGRRLQDRGDLDGAFAAYTRAVELDPRLGAAWRRRAEIREKRDDHRGAISDSDRAIAVWPKDAASWEARGVAKWELRDMEGAAFDLARAVELDPGRAKAWHHLAILRGTWRKAEALPGALEASNRAIELEPRNAGFRLQKAQILLRLKKPGEARKELDRAVALAPTLAAVRGARAMALIGSEEYAAALVDFKRASEVEPKQAMWWYGRGLALARMGKFREALPEFERALKLHSGRHDFWWGRGFARRRLRDYKGADADLTRAIQLVRGKDRKKEAGYYCERGMTRLMQKRLEEALKDLNTALRLDPTHGKAWAFRGRVHERQGKLEAALRDAQRAAKCKLQPVWKRAVAKKIAQLREKLEK